MAIKKNRQEIRMAISRRYFFTTPAVLWLLANGCRKACLALARELLDVIHEPSVAREADSAQCAAPTFVCRHCGRPMCIVHTFARDARIRAPPA